MLELKNGVNYDHKYLFDPMRKAKQGIVCISHAHSDHVRSHEVPVVASDETIALAGIECDRVAPDDIVMHGAGHVLGSTMFEVKDGNGHILFTGDFRYQDSSLFKGAEPVHCDIMIMETTFGMPRYVFPGAQDIEREIQKWVKVNHNTGRTVLLGAYALGKAQELNKILNNIGVVPVVHPKIAERNKVYCKYRRKLEYTVANNERRPFVGIVPHHMLNRDFLSMFKREHQNKVVSCVATGWARAYSFQDKGVDKAFSLSGHADYNELLDFATACEPKQVYTMHGFASEFAKALRSKGFKAADLKSVKAQRTMSQFA